MFGLTQEVLEQYEGTLIHQTSTDFTAVFGAPVAQEDHARRAVLAALALHQRLRRCPVSDAHTPEGGLAVRMGLHSGLGVVGTLGQPHSSSIRRSAIPPPWPRAFSIGPPPGRSS